MVEIAKCKCGEFPHLAQSGKTTIAYECVRCGLRAPWAFTVGDAIREWGSLVQPPAPAPEPAAGAVRVRIGYWRGTPHNLEAASLERQVEVFDPDFVITADIPLPQPVEIPGAVESEE